MNQCLLSLRGYAGALSQNSEKMEREPVNVHQFIMKEIRNSVIKEIHKDAKTLGPLRYALRCGIDYVINSN